jgi:hypothetical protein
MVYWLFWQIFSAVWVGRAEVVVFIVIHRGLLLNYSSIQAHLFTQIWREGSLVR